MTYAVTLRDLKKALRARTLGVPSRLAALAGLVSRKCSEIRAVAANLSSRPTSYFCLRLAEGLGALLARATLLAFFSFGVALTLSGELPGDGWLPLLCGTLTAVVAATLNLVFSAIVGISTLFIEDASPLYCAWQELGIVFGGPMFPLDRYPDTVRSIASVTPFPSSLYAPGRIAVGAGAGFVWQTSWALAGWLTVAIVSAHLACRRARRSPELKRR